MQQVVIYRNGAEELGEEKPWNDAVDEYNSHAKTINAVKADGSWKHPDVRVAIRKV
jgi:hypothetical protein